MSKVLIFFLFIAFIVKCESSEDVIINIIVENEKEKEVKLKIEDKLYINFLDSLGIATLTVKNLQKEKESEIVIGEYIVPLWLEPDKDFDIYVNLDPVKTGIEFYGEGRFKNELWNGKYLDNVNLKDYTTSEDNFKEVIEKRKVYYLHILDSLDIDRGFKQELLAKFNYKIFHDLALYPAYYSSFLTDSVSFPTYGFYTYFMSHFPENSKNQYGYDYKEAFYKWVKGLSFDSNPSNPYSRLMQRLEYIDNNISHTHIKDFLTDRFTVNYINKYGIDSVEVLKTHYNFKVSDRELRLQFENLTKEWEKLQKGNPAPDFKIQVSDTFEITLKDFAGKYTYIYIWNLDNSDSLAHLETFNTLVNRFKGQNINFVNLTIGRSKEIWEQFLQQNPIEGISVYADYHNNILDDYKIYEFPVAILLDREGKIVNPRMTFPENPETVEFFRRLFYRPVLTE